MNRIPDLAGNLGFSLAFGDVVIVLALTVAAWTAGLLVRRVVGPRIEALEGGRIVPEPRRFGPRAGKAAGAAAALLLLGAASAVMQPVGLAKVLMAATTGGTVGYLVFQIGVAVRVGTRLSLAIALAALVIAIAAQLGGLTPLISALDAARFDVGKYTTSLLGIFSGLIFVVFLYAAARFLTNMLSRWLANASDLDASQRLLAQKLVSVAIVVVAIFIGIDVLGIDLTALAVFSGALGLAIGFGMQKTLGNLLSGIILLMDRSIKPGDIIVVGDTVGRVNKIGIRAVSVVTRDAKEFLIPNEKLMTEQVENWSYSSRNVRVRVPVGVSYNSDIKRAQALMLQAATETPRVLDSPPPNVWLKKFGDNAVEHEILVWITDAEAGIGNVKSAVLNQLWELFMAEGIELPFPQRDIHIRTLDERVAKFARLPSSVHQESDK